MENITGHVVEGRRGKRSRGDGYRRAVISSVPAVMPLKVIYDRFGLHYVFVHEHKSLKPDHPERKPFGSPCLPCLVITFDPSLDPRVSRRVRGGA